MVGGCTRRAKGMRVHRVLRNGMHDVSVHVGLRTPDRSWPVPPLITPRLRGIIASEKAYPLSEFETSHPGSSVNDSAGHLRIALDSVCFRVDHTLVLLSPEPIADPPPHVRDRAVIHALGQLETRLPDLNAFAERRAQALLNDHRRVRDASDDRGSYSVKALLPADVIGLFVLPPKED